MRTPILLVILLLMGFASTSCKSASSQELGKALDHAVEVSSLPGPLVVSHRNPRYFADPDGNIVYLTGSHTWANIQDFRRGGVAYTFDYSAHLAELRRYNHNCTRIWAWESSRTDSHAGIEPLPYTRTGPGHALDGKFKFDLSQFNQAYFDRLHDRIAEAQAQGLYVIVMLFQGFSLGRDGAWLGHPFNRANNVNGIDGDADKDGSGLAVHTLRLPKVTQLQQAYVSKVIDTLNDFDNVIWEISNESRSEATHWQYHFIDFIHRYEAEKPKQHPVLMGVQLPKDNNVLLASPAEAISPGADSYAHNPPAADGSKVIISDTDHLWGIGASQEWVWGSFLRGINPIFMDPDDGSFLDGADEAWEAIRWSLGHTRQLANRIPLDRMVPHAQLASSGYCLADPGREYLVYAPCQGIMGGRGCHTLRELSPLSQQYGFSAVTQLLGWQETVTVDLSAAEDVLRIEWFNPATGETRPGGTVTGGRRHTFSAPFSGDAVLHLVIDQGTSA